jgi:hypothetical protein
VFWEELCSLEGGILLGKDKKRLKKHSVKITRCDRAPFKKGLRENLKRRK